MNAVMLEIRVEDRRPTACLKLAGQLARLEVYKLKSAVDELLRGGHRNFIFDCADLRFLDSAGIGAIVLSHAACMAASGTLAIVRPLDMQIEQVMRAAAIHQLAEFFATPKEAFERFAVSAKDSEPAPPLANISESALNALNGALAAIAASLKGIEQRLERIENNLNG